MVSLSCQSVFQKLLFSLLMIPNFTYSISKVSKLNEAEYNIQRKSLGEHKNWLQVSQKCVHENLEPVGCRNWITFSHKDISELGH